MQVNGFSNPLTTPGLNTYGAMSRERTALAETSVTTGPVTVVDSTAQSDSGRRVAAGTSVSSTESRQQQEAEQAVVRELAARDREVRQHEMAHQMAGGQYTGGATYTFERGPDGVMYAVGGEVSIDTSPVPGDPEATLQKAQTIERAAMAPADPSPQDLRVAASARAMAAEARAELLREQQDALQGDEGTLDGLEDQESRDLANADDLTNSVIAERQESVAAVTADEAAERVAEEESAANRRAGVIDEFEAQRARREEIAEEQRERRERAAESLREFARDLAEIQEKLRELNKRLFETGALQNLNTPGNLLDRQA